MSRIYAKRIDKNQNEIVKELIIGGFSVDLDHNDMNVGKHNETKWIELKKDRPFGKNGKLLKGKIKDSQYKLLWDWKGQYNICWDIKQIRALFEVSLIDNRKDFNRGIDCLMFWNEYKDWLTESELNRLRFEGIIKDGVEGKLA